jgi:hypothetical protein
VTKVVGVRAPPPAPLYDQWVRRGASFRNPRLYPLIGNAFYSAGGRTALRGRLKRGLTSISTPTHIWPVATGLPELVRTDLPEPDGYEYKRVLLVPKDINSELKKIADLPKIRSVLQRFISGMYVTGSMQGGPRDLRPDFERLTNVNEVWVMCFRQPKFDQWRLMGRFARFNAFVGLALFRRAFLNGDQKYQTIAADFVARWPTADIPVHTGNTIESYLSIPVRDPYAPSIL